MSEDQARAPGGVEKVTLYRFAERPESAWVNNPDLPEHLSVQTLAQLEVRTFLSADDVARFITETAESLSRAEQPAAAFALVVAAQRDLGIDCDPTPPQEGDTDE